MNSLSDSSPTLQSIAEHCGVSHVTVWRALRGGTVHPATALRIRDYARKVGYEKESDARTSSQRLRTKLNLKKEATILIPYRSQALTSNDQAVLFWEYVAGVTEAASLTGSRVQLMELNRTEEELPSIRQLLSKGVDGVLDFGLTPETGLHLYNEGIPLVTLITSQQATVFSWACLRADHLGGFYDAWSYLVSMGHRRVGFIGFSNVLASGMRLRECLAAAHLIDENLDLATDIRISVENENPCIWEEMTAVLGPYSSKSWPTAFFCTNDLLAHRIALSLANQGHPVPESISIVGFDNAPIAASGIIGITTIANPRKKIGEAMLHMLENIIVGRPGSRTAHQVLPMQLIKRNSVQRLSDGVPSRIDS